MKLIDSKPEPKFSDFRQLLKLHWNRPADEIYKPWRRQGDSVFFLSRSSWGMAAVTDAVALSLGRSPNVLVPEYFCDQALWPMRAHGRHLAFYPVDQSARPDWSRMKDYEGKTDVFILPHFFGHANDVEAARSFCDRSGALLIEDAAHAMCAAPGIGELGDIVFYSPWKFFPVPNGSVLVVRSGAKIEVDSVENSIKELGDAPSRGFNWVKKAISEQTKINLNSSIPKSISEADFLADATTLPMPTRPRAAPFVLPLLAAVDVAAAGARRRENDAAIRSFFSAMPGWTPMFETPSPAPFKSVFRLDSVDQVVAAHRALRSVGVIAEGWPGLPPEVDQKTSEAGAIRAKVINMPCHQGLTPERIIEALKLAKPSLSSRQF